MATRNDYIPKFSVKGSNYEVGYQVGLEFKCVIHGYMEAAAKSFKPIFDFYDTDDGKRMYNDSLTLLKNVFPEYVKEIEGIADGAKIAFHKLFLLHLDAAYSTNEEELLQHSKIGCSTVLCNFPEQQLIGHNEDALPNALNHCYVVDVEIIEENSEGIRITKEKFMSLCYAGELPGFCCGCNRHGIAFSINVIQSSVHCGRIPRHFLCRAMLGAKNFDQLINILRATGYGVSDSMSVNLGVKDAASWSLYNIEVAPQLKKHESLLDVYEIKPNESYLHCNSFKRLDVPDCNPDRRISSEHREEAYRKLPMPVDVTSTLNVLGDQSDTKYSIFRDGNETSQVVTVATGVFNFTKGNWTLYSKNPKTCIPIAEYPLC